MRLLKAASIAAALALVWIWLAAVPRSYEFSGRVAGFGDDDRTVFIEHGEIPGYGPAMTQPFSMEDTSLLRPVKMGDAVSGRFESTGGTARIIALRKLAANALPAHPAAQRDNAAVNPAFDPLEIGEAVPDVRLVDQSGSAFDLSALEGRYALITFIYTECPMPTFCPLMSERFAALQPMLREEFGKQVRLLSISFDPDKDTPAVLREYASRYTDDLSTWTFAVPASANELERAKKAFGISTFEAEDEIIHNLTTTLVDPRGRIIWQWRGNDWTPEDVVEVLRTSV